MRILSGSCAIMLVGMLVACDSDNDAKQLRNRVTVATQNYDAVEIRSASDVLEADTLSALTLWAGNGEPSIEHTTDAIWASNAVDIAKVSSAGLVSALADGNVTISAQFGSLTATRVLRVSSAPLTSISLDAPATLDECESVQISATGLFAADDGSERNITDAVSWSVSNTPATVGVFSSVTPGLFRSSNTGSAVITATRGSISRQATIAIADNLESLTLLPVSPVLSTSRPTVFSVTAGYNNKDATPDISDNASWVIADTGIASIDNTLPGKGTLNPFANSNTTMTVSCGGQQVVRSLEIGDPSIVESIKFGREDNPFSFDYQGSEIIVQLRAVAVLQTQNEETITEDVDWIVQSRDDGTPITLSNDSGSKGQLTVRGRGSITVRIEYDFDSDRFNEDDSTFNKPTLTINVL